MGPLNKPNTPWDEEQVKQITELHWHLIQPQSTSSFLRWDGLKPCLGPGHGSKQIACWKPGCCWLSGESEIWKLENYKGLNGQVIGCSSFLLCRCSFKKVSEDLAYLFFGFPCQRRIVGQFFSRPENYFSQFLTRKVSLHITRKEGHQTFYIIWLNILCLSKYDDYLLATFFEQKMMNSG